MLVRYLTRYRDTSKLASHHQTYPGGVSVMDTKLQTWTFVGHWEDSRIVVEYVLPGDVEDERIDTGYWDEGLWAASGSGETMESAQAATVAEYES
jgi:hypothetical protein